MTLKATVVFLVLGLATVSSQMFDKRPTIYDHMKSGANTVKSNLIESELQVENLVSTSFAPYMSTNLYKCRVDWENKML